MASGGKDTHEYKSVLSRLTCITEYLKVNQPAKDSLTQKFQQHEWLDIVAKPTEEQLVKLALIRIENDVNQFAEFTTMLKQTAGMDLIVDKLKGTSNVVITHVIYCSVHTVILITSFTRSCGPMLHEKLCVSIYREENSTILPI